MKFERSTTNYHANRKPSDKIYYHWDNETDNWSVSSHLSLNHDAAGDCIKSESQFLNAANKLLQPEYWLHIPMIAPVIVPRHCTPVLIFKAVAGLVISAMAICMTWVEI
jgi:hypothetical protein